MFIPIDPQFYSDGIAGDNPVFWWGVDAPDGDALPWSSAPIGSKYVYVDTANEFSRTYDKLASGDADTDWSAGLYVVQKTLTYDQFTDGGAAIGTYDLEETLPAGVTVLKTSVTSVTGFAGDTSAVVKVGTSSDDDRFSSGTASVFADTEVAAVGGPTGNANITTEETVQVSVTTASDYTSVTAGQMTVRIYVYG